MITRLNVIYGYLITLIFIIGNYPFEEVVVMNDAFFDRIFRLLISRKSGADEEPFPSSFLFRLDFSTIYTSSQGCMFLLHFDIHIEIIIFFC